MHSLTASIGAARPCVGTSTEWHLRRLCGKFILFGKLNSCSESVRPQRRIARDYRRRGCRASVAVLSQGFRTAATVRPSLGQLREVQVAVCVDGLSFSTIRDSAVSYVLSDGGKTWPRSSSRICI